MMKLRIILLVCCCCCMSLSAAAQRTHAKRAHSSAPPVDEREFGPVVRAYLGYLDSEQGVVDARESRREISATYYRRNSNRIRALRQMAIHIARETRNDYLPELEAVAVDELNTLFESPPAPQTFHQGEILENTFRYLGAVREGETFYLFERLDPYEQADLIQHQKQSAPNEPQPKRPATPATAEPIKAVNATNAAHGAAATARPRRVSPP
jgi:hypothetical protein